MTASPEVTFSTELSDQGETGRRASVTEQINGHNQTPKMHKAVFVNADAMKEKLRENMHKAKYDVTNFYHNKGVFQSIARNPLFDNITLGVITFNALWLAIDTDANTATVPTDAHPVFMIAENLFCVFFTGELFIRFASFKNKLNCFRDAWFLFDLLLVTMMILETWVLVAIVALSGGGPSGNGLGNSGLLKLMRLMRLSRMGRIVRLLRAMPELLILIKGMVAATRSVCVTLFLLMMIVYIFGILFRLLSEGTETGKIFFPGILSSMHSLVVFGLLHSDIADLMDQIEEDGAYILIVSYYVFVLFASLTVMNMLIGVLCEVITAVAQCEHEEIQIINVKDKLGEIVERQCEDLDNVSNRASGEGQLKIHKDTFMKILMDEQCTQLLAEVKVDCYGLVELVDTLFSTEDGDERVLFFPDLVELIMDQRNSNIATVKDVTDLRKFVKGRLDKLDLGIRAQTLGLGRLLERGLKVPKGTWEKHLEQVSEARFEEMGHLGGILELSTQKSMRQKDPLTRIQGEASQEAAQSQKPWELPLLEGK